MLARLEEGRTRELRHDFRVYYSTSYDDVATDEAIDLVMSLPRGSLYRASVDARDSWSDEKYDFAALMDLLAIMHWRQIGSPPAHAPSPIQRPGDAERHAEAVSKSRMVRERIRKTAWKEAD